MNTIWILNIIIYSIILIFITSMLIKFKIKNKNSKQVTKAPIKEFNEPIELDNAEVDKYLTKTHIDTIKAIYNDLESGIEFGFVNVDNDAYPKAWCDICDLCEYSTALKLDDVYGDCEKKLLIFKNNIKIYIIKHSFELLHYIHFREEFKHEYLEWLIEHQQWEYKNNWHTHTIDSFDAYKYYLRHSCFSELDEFMENKGISQYRIISNINTLKEYNMFISCIEKYKNTIDNIKEQKRLEKEKKQRLEEIEQEKIKEAERIEQEKKDKLKLFTKSYFEIEEKGV